MQIWDDPERSQRLEALQAVAWKQGTPPPLYRMASMTTRNCIPKVFKWHSYTVKPLFGIYLYTKKEKNTVMKKMK